MNEITVAYPCLAQRQGSLLKCKAFMSTLQNKYAANNFLSCPTDGQAGVTFFASRQRK
jgi:hypothetical protein